MLRWFVIGSFVFFLAGCLNPPEYSPIPSITFDSVSTTSVLANHDTLTFYISFSDGDGDIGSETDPNLFYKDGRTGSVNNSKIPYITPEGKVKDISGQIVFYLPWVDSINDGQKDSIYYIYTLQIIDRAGHLSNEVTTPLIFEYN